MTPPPPRTSPLEHPLIRIALAAAILAGLAAAAFVARSGGSSSDSSVVVSPTTTNDPQPTSEAGLGAIGDDPPIIRRPAPDFALRDSTGRIVRLSDLRGKVVWVNFWASWCVPCKKELPDIQALYDEKKEAGLEVLAVNYQEDVQTATQFFDARSLHVPMLLDSSGSVYEEYRLQGLPDSFFVDRDGNLAAQQFGFLTPAKMRERLAAAGLP